MQRRLTAALCVVLSEVDAHLSGTDSGAARVNTLWCRSLCHQLRRSSENPLLTY